MRASDVRRLLDRPPQGDLTEAVRQVIRGARQTGWLSIDRVASLAGISVRTLQRRLAQEGGVFSELLDEVRTELAVQMLTTTEASLAEIAQAKREYGGLLLVDEAHSLGMLGAHGRGVTEAAGVEDDVLRALLRHDAQGADPPARHLALDHRPSRSVQPEADVPVAGPGGQEVDRVSVGLKEHRLDRLHQDAAVVLVGDPIVVGTPERGEPRAAVMASGPADEIPPGVVGQTEIRHENIILAPAVIAPVPAVP